MTISKAKITHLDTLYKLTCSCAANLIEKGIRQWSQNYPSKSILKNDLELQQLWILQDEGLIKGMIVLTEIVDEEYKHVKWMSPNGNNLYVHRLAVLPEFQGQGCAQKLMDFAEIYARKHSYVSIRLDTFSKNQRNQNFYEKRNYSKLGEVYFKNQSDHPFYAYEMLLKPSTG
jgi:ribosomal protein S18 acetylase RimI-like enzyme